MFNYTKIIKQINKLSYVENFMIVMKRDDIDFDIHIDGMLLQIIYNISNDMWYVHSETIEWHQINKCMDIVVNNIIGEVA